MAGRLVAPRSVRLLSASILLLLLLSSVDILVLGQQQQQQQNKQPNNNNNNKIKNDKDAGAPKAAPKGQPPTDVQDQLKLLQKAAIQAHESHPTFRLSSSHQKQLALYPWSNKPEAMMDRADQILDDLRSNMHLRIFDDFLPNALKQVGNMFIRNKEGTEFAVSIDDDSSSKSSKSSNTARGGSTQQQQQQYPPRLHKIGQHPPIDLTDADTILDHLRSVCEIHTIDYWSYEWCHRSEIRQVGQKSRNTYLLEEPLSSAAYVIS